jgi:hypothetical protein
MRLWHQADQTGVPVTRPLWLAYPNDPQAAQQDQEWLLGPDVLVAPVVAQGASSRQVYFPAGCWIRPDTGTRYTGPSTHTIPAALDQLPYFFVCGTQPFATTSSAPGCAGPAGQLAGAKLGPVTLGQTRRNVRREFAGFMTRHRRYMDFFCPTHDGIRVGYPSPKLLRTLTARQRRQARNRAVLVLTANRHYALGAIRAGTHLSAAHARLRHARHYRVGLNTWYLLASRTSTGVLKVQHRRIEEIGIANPRLVATPRSARRFLRAFR